MDERKQIEIGLSGRLAEFLPASQRSGQFTIDFQGRQSIKHLLESAGVPHTEVGRLLASGKRIDFSYLPQAGDRIEVLPASPELDELSCLHQDGQLTIEPRFVLDNHLGKLATLLRMLGLDCLYRNDFQDAELSRIAAAGERILLTRDRRLLMRKNIRFGYCIRSLEPQDQISEILSRFSLSAYILPFHRCLRCNTLLEPVEKAAILDRLEPLTRLYFHEFHRCPACGQVYWKGSHYQHMVERLHQILPGSI